MLRVVRRRHNDDDMYAAAVLPPDPLVLSSQPIRLSQLRCFERSHMAQHLRLEWPTAWRQPRSPLSVCHRDRCGGSHLVSLCLNIIIAGIGSFHHTGVSICCILDITAPGSIASHNQLHVPPSAGAILHLNSGSSVCLYDCGSRGCRRWSALCHWMCNLCREAPLTNLRLFFAI